MKIIGIIPARFASTRFPGKPLIDILGKTMIQRVYEQAKKSDVLQDIYVATDDKRIYNHVNSWGGKVIMTSPYPKNGTERCAEALGLLTEKNILADVIINIQGDEPFFEPQSLKLLADCFVSDNVQIATLVKEIENQEDTVNSSVIKVVKTLHNKALYFSRAAIPFNRENEAATNYKHIGIYAYRTKVLNEIVKLKESELERIEKLEQLRWLENGYQIYVNETQHESNSIDTPKDLEDLLRKLK